MKNVLQDFYEFLYTVQYSVSNPYSFFIRIRIQPKSWIRALRIPVLFLIPYPVYAAADGEQDGDPGAGPLPAGDAEVGSLPRAVAHLPLDGGGRYPAPGNSARQLSNNSFANNNFLFKK